MTAKAAALKFLAASSTFCFSIAAGAAAPPPLTVVPDAGTIPTGPRAAYCVLPARPVSDESPLTHTFRVRNGTKTAVTIERVALSCDCVQATLGETSSLPVTVAPGQTLPVRLRVTMQRQIPGRFSKSAWLYWHGALDRGLRLELRTVVHDSAAP